MKNLISRALAVAVKAHIDQTDRAGMEYILHPLRIMNKMNTLNEKAVAILHDVIEDSDMTKESLIEDGIPVHIVEAVSVLSKHEGENYSDYILRVSENDLARRVKMVDLEDNLDVLRLKTLSEKDLFRVFSYHRSYKVLKCIEWC